MFNPCFGTNGLEMEALSLCLPVVVDGVGREEGDEEGAKKQKQRERHNQSYDTTTVRRVWLVGQGQGE